MRTKKQTGFTLIELLVVIAIIALLASIVLVALGSARAKSRDAKRIGDIRQLGTALELYYNDNNQYPTGGSFTEDGVAVTMPIQLAPSYVGGMPSAPTPADGSCGSTTSSPSNLYQYSSASPYSTYTLTFCLGGQTGGLGSGVHTESPNGIQ